MPGDDETVTAPVPPRPGIGLPGGTATGWLAIFAGALGLFLVRFLVPTAVGQADNRDGARLMCGPGLRLRPVLPPGGPRYFRFAYFPYVPTGTCGHRLLYPTSEIVPLELARLLTPILGLRGSLNLIALGVLMCVLAAVGIASLVVGLRVAWWARVVLAAALWLVLADATFFDLFASPFEEPAVLVGLLLVTAGTVYLGRGWRGTLTGLALAGPGGFLVILAKEQYLPLLVPICLTLILASARKGQAGEGGGSVGLRRYLSRQTAAAVAVATVLALLAGAYGVWDARSSYGKRLHHIQAVDMIFDDIVNGHDNAPADLRALGLPVSWQKYAGHYYWEKGSVRNNPLYPRYETRLTDGNIAHFLLTHPGRVPGIGQQAASYAQEFRVTALGDYPPGAGHRPGAIDSRVIVVTWLMHQLPRRLGLYWLVSLWAVLAAIAVIALRRRSGGPWLRDGAAAVLCLIGCAVVAFVPPAYFEGISTTRHMVGMNLANCLAFVLAAALAASMISAAVLSASLRGPPASPFPRRRAPPACSCAGPRRAGSPVRPRPLLVGLAVAGIDVYSRAAGGAGAQHVQAQPGLLADDRAVGFHGPFLVRAAVARPQLDLRSRRRLVVEDVEALGGPHRPQLPGRGHGELLVDPAVAAPDLLRGPREVHVGSRRAVAPGIQALAGLGAEELTGARRRGNLGRGYEADPAGRHGDGVRAGDGAE
jgi:hypothetical protein